MLEGKFKFKIHISFPCYRPCCVCLVVESCLDLCDPMDCRPPGSSVPGISQTRTLEWVAMPSSRGSSRTRDWTHISWISCTGRQVLYHCATWKPPGPVASLLFLTRSSGRTGLKDSSVITLLPRGLRPELTATPWCCLPWENPAAVSGRVALNLSYFGETCSKTHLCSR